MNKNILIALLLCVPLTAGCASGQHNSRTETTTVSTVPNDEVTTSSTSTTTVKETTAAAPAPEHRGVIGGVFHTIGTVLAFPFKLVAGIIEAIF